MAEIVWTASALAQIGSIADYIALENPYAADRLVERIYLRVELLQKFPALGSRVPEFPRSACRHLVEPPCRIFYRMKGAKILILFVMRFEMLLRKEYLS